MVRMKISGNLKTNWNDKEIQRFVSGLKTIRIIANLGGVMTIQGSSDDIKKLKDFINEE